MLPNKQIMADAQTARCIFEALGKIKEPAYMKESYLALAMLLSGNDLDVIKEVSLFFDNPKEYFNKYKGDLEGERGIDSLSELQKKPSIVLNDTLTKKDLMLVIDENEDLEEYIEEGYLQDLNKNALKNVKCIKELEKVEPEEYHSISTLVEHPEKQSAIIDCISSEGYSFFIIGEDNSSYPLSLVKNTDRSKILELGKKAKLEFFLLPRVTRY